MALALATDSGGIVLEILMQRGVSPPVLNDVCNNKRIAKNISAFKEKTLTKAESDEFIAHAKKCRPCRKKLGWGDL